LHFTVSSNFGKVYPSKNSFKLFQSCILPPFPNFAKVAFYGPVEIWQSFIQSFILATSTRLHPSLHFANYPINPVNRSLLCTFITGIIYIPVVILFGYDDFIEKG